MTRDDKGRIVGRDCTACSGPATPARLAGPFLRYLYPGEVFCNACGRRSLHCTCRRRS